MPFRRLPPLTSLRTFESAGRLGSFKAAAEELFVTPSAVSQQIRTLEEDLGVKLFVRAPRSVTLTSKGQRLHLAVKSAFRDIRTAVQEMRLEPSKDFEITCTPPVASKWLAPRLSTFAEEIPDVSVRVHSSFDAEDLDIDGTRIAICTFHGAPPTDLHAEKICDEVLLPLASPELVAELKLTDPHDISRAQLLHDSSLSDSGWASPWGDWFQTVGLPRAGAKGGSISPGSPIRRSTPRSTALGSCWGANSSPATT